jgi:hypothetical protein
MKRKVSLKSFVTGIFLIFTVIMTDGGIWDAGGLTVVGSPVVTCFFWLCAIVQAMWLGGWIGKAVQTMIGMALPVMNASRPVFGKAPSR